MIRLVRSTIICAVDRLITVVQLAASPWSRLFVGASLLRTVRARLSSVPNVRMRMVNYGPMPPSQIVDDPDTRLLPRSVVS